jgi:hypothetical protein
MFQQSGHLKRQSLSRRQLLKVGGIGSLGLTLPSSLRAEQVSNSAASEKSCIFILQYGGPPHQDMFDMKPESPEEIRGAFRPIDTNVPGIQICEKMPLLAQRADRYCLVRSMQTTNSGHDGGMHICMTGHRNPKERTPYYGSVISKLRPSKQNIPSYVWVQNLAGDVKPWYLSGGFLGMAHAPLRVGTDLDIPSNPKFRFRDFDPPQDCSEARFSNRQRLLARLDNGRPAIAGREPNSFTDLQQKAFELVTGNETKRAFDLNYETQKKRQRYGMHPLGQNLLMARRLVEAGARLVTVVAFTGVPPGEKFKNVQSWDMHGVLYKPRDSIFGNSAYGLSWSLPNVDQAVSALLDDLQDRGLLETTLVAMAGEFGRTKVNNRGRDHWPHCYSAMLAGCGIRGGSVYGQSDANAQYVKNNPVMPENFSATLFHALGVPPETLIGPDGFPIRASDGKSISALFG